MNAKEIASRVQTSSTSSSGCWCIFVPLSETEGLKLYPAKDMRDGAVRLQKKAASLGLGPQVKNESVEMPMLESWDRPLLWKERGYANTSTGTMLYGYVTEIVSEGIPDLDVFDSLIERLQANGICVTDLSKAVNVGMTRDGRAVMFDFDPVFYHGVGRMSEIA